MMATPGIHKRRASASLDSKTEQQRERKRLQNRISQQCFREKQASYIKHLEQFVESIEHSDGFAGTEAAERLRLIRENHALRDSLMHMRKKLLSLGAQVTSLANLDSEVVLSPRSVDDEPHIYHPGEEPAHDEDSPVSSTTTKRTRTGSQQTILEATLSGQPLPQPLESKPISSLSPPDVAQESAQLPRPGIYDTDISTFFAASSVEFSPDVGIIVCKPANVSTKSPLLVMEAKIQKAMAEFDLRAYHDALCIRSFVDDLSTAEIQDFEGQILSSIVHLAMRTVVKTSRIGGYGHLVVGTGP
ncbi:hypothetical protein BDW75DRAFT_77852 [Aspergillus navahoensis]